MIFNVVTQNISITENLVINVSKPNYVRQMLTDSSSVQQQAQTASTDSHLHRLIQTLVMSDSVQIWVSSSRQTNQICTELPSGQSASHNQSHVHGRPVHEKSIATCCSRSEEGDQAV